MNGVTTTPPAAPRRARPAGFAELRPHHWIKNTLVVIPLAAAHELRDVALLERVGLAFVAFSLAASGLYVVNDLLDVEADRGHQSNATRPFAAGELTRPAAIALATAAWLGAGVVAAQLDPRFAGVVAAYVLLMIAYSLGVKRIVFVCGS